MKLVWVSLLALVACNPDHEGTDWPIEPGGGTSTVGTTPGSLPDAPTTGDGGATIEGRVCDITPDLRVWSTCGPRDLDGLTVTLGTGMANTIGNGTFEIPAPAGSPVWKVEGGTQVTSLMHFGGVHSIPSISKDAYEDLGAATGITLDTTAGGIFVRIKHGSAFLSGATVSTDTTFDGVIQYDDDAAASDFDIDQTSTHGIAWIPNVEPSATVTVTITPPVGMGAPTDVPLLVEAGAITFATVEIP